MDTNNQSIESDKVGLLERNLHDYLENNPNLIGVGNCTVIAREYVVDSGRIDLVVENSEQEIWAVELKIGEASRDAIGQIASYVSSLADDFPEHNVFGLLIASSFDTTAIRAHKSLRNIGLSTYQLHFSIQNFEEPIFDIPSTEDDESNDSRRKKVVNYTYRRCINCHRDNKYEVGTRHSKCSYCGYKFGVA